MIFKRVLRNVPATALFGAVLLSSPMAAIANPAASIHVEAENAVTAELNYLRTAIRELNYDADQLNPLIQPRLHWSTHASHLNRIRDDVNRIGDRIEALRDMRSFAAPWQQDAVDDIVPIAIEVADRTSKAISHLNENHQYLWAPQYTDHLRTIAAQSDQMENRLGTHMEIMEARDKIETLQEKLAEAGS